jgi:hypothetical protein
MSTNDVPGAVSSNRDSLSMGCWAEHEDGSLIFVQSTENGRVIYMIFDIATDPITEYRDAMPEDGFKKRFSWNSKDPKSVKWTWHDKTPFPWDRVIKHGANAGQHYASAHDMLNAAQRVAKSLDLKGQEYNPEADEHMQPKVSKGPVGDRIIRAIQAAINELGI